MFERLNFPDGQRGRCWHYSVNQSLKPPHRHRELEFNLMVEGRIEYVVGEERVEATAGDILWLYSNREHALIARSSDVRMWIGVFRDSLKRACGSDQEVTPVAKSVPSGFRLHTLTPRDFRLAQGLCEVAAEALAEENWHATALQSLLQFIARATARAKSRSGIRPIHPAVARAVRVFDSESELPSLDELATVCGLSKFHLSRLFHEQIGSSIQDYRSRIAVERAKEHLLMHPEKTLLEVAFDTGFGSYPQFNRLFRQQTGTGPRAWLKSHRETAEK